MSYHFLSVLWPPQTWGWNGRIWPFRGQNRQKWSENAKNEKWTLWKIVDFGQTSVLKVVGNFILSGKVVWQPYFEWLSPEYRRFKNQIFDRYNFGLGDLNEACDTIFPLRIWSSTTFKTEVWPKSTIFQRVHFSFLAFSDHFWRFWPRKGHIRPFHPRVWGGHKTDKKW